MLGILCSGQGAQHPAMLAPSLAHPSGGGVIQRAGAVLGRDLAALTDADDIFANALAQPLICAHQLALWTAMAPSLPRPRAVAGYSLGELTAHALAGAIDADHLVELAVRRAALMDAASPISGGLMAVRGLPLARVAALCREHDAHVAIINDFDRVVVGGPVAASPGLKAAVEDLGGQTTPLNVQVASHTPMLAAAVALFAQALTDRGVKAPMVPVVAGIDAAPVWTGGRVTETLSRQISEPIRWADCLDTLVEMGCDVLLELGPGAALARMASERHPTIAARSVDDFQSLDGVARWVENALRREGG